MWTKHIPKYWQLASLLKEEITSRGFKRGSQFYSVRELMEKYKVSDSTIQKCLTELVNEGILNCEIGKGTFISNLPDIPSEQKNKVIRAILPHGYKDSTSDFYYGGIMKGMLGCLPPKYELRFMNSEENKNIPAELNLSDTSGVLIVAPSLYHKSWLLQIKEHIPTGAMIIIGASFKNGGFDSVDTDNVKGADEATEYLIRLGHRKIGIILGRLSVTNIVDRFKGYKQALKRNNIKFNEELAAKTGKNKTDRAYQSILKLLNLSPRPTAIFATGYSIAREVMRAANEIGLKIPDELSLIGFDDPGAEYTFSSILTTVRQPVYEMGRIATLELLRSMENHSKKPVKKYLETELIERKTCARINNKPNKRTVKKM